MFPIQVFSISSSPVTGSQLRAKGNNARGRLNPCPQEIQISSASLRSRDLLSCQTSQVTGPQDMPVLLNSGLHGDLSVPTPSFSIPATVPSFPEYSGPSLALIFPSGRSFFHPVPSPLREDCLQALPALVSLNTLIYSIHGQ